MAEHRYDPMEIEPRWQRVWADEETWHVPNDEATDASYVLEMLPYPSGEPHIGHLKVYSVGDAVAHFHRRTGRRVLHPMGYDAFGLPAENHAIRTGQHPAVSTNEAIAEFQKQFRRWGVSIDWSREFGTHEPSYYRWTQWIFLQIYNSWYDVKQDRARPIAELVDEFRAGLHETTYDLPFDDLGPIEQRELVDSYRLAYVDEVPVNWCPGLGTVLANEEVTAEGRSERGNFPVYKRPLKQWMLRITSYADRWIADLDQLDWPESMKQMQRNWIGRSTGAHIRFPVAGREDVDIEVFTTRPDTVFGATYMVLAPEHPLVDVITANEWPGDDMFVDWESNPLDSWKGVFGAVGTPADAVTRYREYAARRTDLERQAEGKEKTGAFIGTFAVNPLTNTRIPVFVADYVLMGYGTGAIMAVPGQDERDWEFAEEFDLPIIRTVQPPPDFDGDAYAGDGPAINSGFLDGMHVDEAKAAIIAWLEEHGYGAGAVTYKLRDWLFSRQRYWGEPFPIVYDEIGPVALPDTALPVELPEMTDFEPKTSDDPDALPDVDVAIDPVAGRAVGCETRDPLNCLPALVISR